MGLIPRFLKLMSLSSFVKQLRAPGSGWLSKREVAETLAKLMERGEITPVIDSTFALSEIREAFRHMMEDELYGKMIITPQPS